MSSNIVGLAWFDAGEYVALRAALKDGESALPAAHAAWLEDFKAREVTEIVRGREVCRVVVTKADFIDWCNGLMLPTYEACELYATVQARRQASSGPALRAAPQVATHRAAPESANAVDTVAPQAPPAREPAEIVLAAHRAELLPPVRPQRLETGRNLARRP